jgi:FtsP/CotA-like multicopper oxidase with cupredoxin domain
MDTSGTGAQSTLLTLSVEGAAFPQEMSFPTKDNYPALPTFLDDITDDEIHITRRLDFGWEANRVSPGSGTGGRAPQFMIDGRRFSGERYDQTMVLKDAEEWVLTNTTAQIAHPFHIHINPFQIVEINDPTSGTNYKAATNRVWRDVIAIPPSTFDSNGKIDKCGYVKIRHRFVDFPGSYVLHCHMLAHEDRGMMQLIRVISGEALVVHH